MLPLLDIFFCVCEILFKIAPGAAGTNVPQDTLWAVSLCSAQLSKRAWHSCTPTAWHGT